MKIATQHPTGDAHESDCDESNKTGHVDVASAGEISTRIKQAVARIRIVQDI